MKLVSDSSSKGNDLHVKMFAKGWKLECNIKPDMCEESTEGV